MGVHDGSPGAYPPPGGRPPYNPGMFAGPPPGHFGPLMGGPQMRPGVWCQRYPYVYPHHTHGSRFTLSHRNWDWLDMHPCYSLPPATSCRSFSPRRAIARSFDRCLVPYPRPFSLHLWLQPSPSLLQSLYPPLPFLYLPPPLPQPTRHPTCSRSSCDCCSSCGCCSFAGCPPYSAISSCCCWSTAPPYSAISSCCCRSTASPHAEGSAPIWPGPLGRPGAGHPLPAAPAAAPRPARRPHGDGVYTRPRGRARLPVGWLVCL